MDYLFTVVKAEYIIITTMMKNKILHESIRRILDIDRVQRLTNGNIILLKKH